MPDGYVPVPYGANFCNYIVSSTETHRLVKMAWEHNLAHALSERKGEAGAKSMVKMCNLSAKDMQSGVSPRPVMPM